jgi:Flp pilus assembly protein TadG
MRINRRKGAVIAESAAAMTLLLPVLMTVLFIALEVSYAYLIKYNLSEAAREASRDLAIEYGLDSTITGSRALQDAKVFDHIRIKHMVNDSAQFDNPVFNTAAKPYTVQVTVEYKSGQYGLPIFPAPDPLGISKTVHIVGTSSFRLQ